MEPSTFERDMQDFKGASPCRLYEYSISNWVKVRYQSPASFSIKHVMGGAGNDSLCCDNLRRKREISVQMGSCSLVQRSDFGEGASISYSKIW